MQLPYSILLLLLCCLACHDRPMNEPQTKTNMSYTEQHRPQFHFTPPEKWMNDPNGMVFYEGEYHLFYQYYPDGTVWGPMHWGHAISTDLLHWEHLPIALYPDSLGYIFSGSAVVDWNNTSGFGVDGQPPLISIFTYHDMEGERQKTETFQSQAIAYSNDKGRTWTKYEGNPVISNPGIRDFRDPKVIWDEDSAQWVMVFAAGDHVMLYGSQNMKDWTFLSDFGREWGSHGGVWECPDLFPMTIEDTGEEKWVLLLSINPGGPNGGSATQYFVGDFDGKAFTLDPSFAEALGPINQGESEEPEKAIWLDYGRDNYAGVTWSDIPKADGRRIFIGWMSNWDYAREVPTEKWRSAMTLPRTLSLENTAQGPRLFQAVISEFEGLTKEIKAFSFDQLSGEEVLTESKKPATSQWRIQLEATVGDLESAALEIKLVNDLGEEYKIGLDGKTNRFYSDRTKAGKISFSEKFAVGKHWADRQGQNQQLEIDLIIDRSSAELLADQGAVALTDLFFPTADFTKIMLSASSNVTNIKGKIYEVTGVW